MTISGWDFSNDLPLAGTIIGYNLNITSNIYLPFHGSGNVIVTSVKIFTSQSSNPSCISWNTDLVNGNASTIHSSSNNTLLIWGSETGGLGNVTVPTGVLACPLAFSLNISSNFSKEKSLGEDIEEDKEYEEVLQLEKQAEHQ